jgi:polyisoprenoid-binding protein YceI
MSVADRGSVARVAVPAGRWSVDTSRSSVTFTVKHMLLTTMTGRFRDFDGTLDLESSPPRATGAVNAASIDTDEPVRDEHLRRSPDFFDAERHPEISFDSTSIDHLDSRRMRIVGDLTMRSVTRQIQLDGRLDGGARDTGDGEGERIELELPGALSRRDFGLSWNQMLDTGGVLLGDKVKISLRISAVKGDVAES